jgi:choice-of-anchor B domain-containing protein
MKLRLLASLLAIGIIVSCDDDDAPSPAQISLLSQIEIPGNMATDVWGFVDPSSDIAYAAVGDFSNLREGNVTLVNLEDPSNPQIASTTEVIGFDMKTFGPYLYATNSDFTSASDDSSRILNINDPVNPQVVGAFQAAHNIFIDGTYLYVSFEFAPGLRIFDLAADPTDPPLIWEDDSNIGAHDVAVIRNRMYDFHGVDATYIYDVQDPNNPQLLGAVRNPGTFHHSGWVTEDDRYLFICDEIASDPLPDITIWDIGDPANPILVGDISDNAARAHNLYIVDDLAYVSYYGAGFKIFDVSSPATPVLLDQFDTNLNSGIGIGNGFEGAFGVFPFTNNGTILVSDMDNGLFVFEFQ